MLENSWFKKEKPLLGLTGMGGGVGSNLVGGGDTGLPVEEVFDIKLYAGNNSANIITNGMNLDVSNGSPGGLVLMKVRNYDGGHFAAYDTARGASTDIHFNLWNMSDDRSGGAWASYGLNSFNTNGFTLGGNWMWENGSGYDHVAWTFMKSEKFFDICTWNGNTTAGRDIPHNLGCDPGMIIVKRLNGTGEWFVWHHSLNMTERDALQMNSTAAMLNSSSPTSEDFWEAYSGPAPDMNSSTFTVGSCDKVNATSNNYLAYLFAKDESNIKCGKYTGSGSSGNSVTVGFKPQFLLIKRAIGGAGDWLFLDTTRGINSSGNDQELVCPTVADEDGYDDYVTLTNDGFDVEITWDAYNKSGDEYIYVAIKEED